MLKRKFEDDLINIEKNIKKIKINENKINQKRKFKEDCIEVEKNIKNIKKMKINENDLSTDYINYKRTILMYL